MTEIRHSDHLTIRLVKVLRFDSRVGNIAMKQTHGVVTTNVPPRLRPVFEGEECRITRLYTNILLIKQFFYDQDTSSTCSGYFLG